MKKMEYCTRCVYPTSTVNLQMNGDNVCSSCRVAEEFEQLPSSFWQQRKEKFEKLISPYINNNKSNYDCLIPVSGGKDSYYQTHMMEKKWV